MRIISISLRHTPTAGAKGAGFHGCRIAAANREDGSGVIFPLRAVEA